MSLVLGVSAYYHDSAAAIVRDGTIVAAAHEERFSRRKHDASFPEHAINYCLEEAFVDVAELDAIVFYEDPLLKIDRVVRTAAAYPHGAGRVPLAALGQEPFIDRELRSALSADVPVLVTEHHASHAASAFFPSPFPRAAIVTIDGVGEWCTASIGRGCGARIELLRELRFPHSLGMLYAAITEFCGFRPNGDEYKIMGLAAYGQPRFVAVLEECLAELLPDGAVRLETGAFGFLDGDSMMSDAFSPLFEGPPRRPDGPMTEREADLAASVQALTERAVVRCAEQARELTGERALVLAGGVALNAVANGRLASADIFERLWVQPASGDAGGALGAALIGAHHGFADPRDRAGVAAAATDGQHGSLLGPAFSSAEVRAFLDSEGCEYEVVSDEQRARLVAEALARGSTVGFAVGRMEFGPRALGARSILADPRDVQTRDRLNRDVKRREEFRPFAPAVLAERAGELFVLRGPTGYMLTVLDARAAACELVPAVVHVDGSARVQTVDRGEAPLRKVLEAFEALTGCPALLNTSFNLSDEPIVCSPEDAYHSFRRGGLDVLVLEDCVVSCPSGWSPPAIERRVDQAWQPAASDCGWRPVAAALPQTPLASGSGFVSRPPEITLRPYESRELGRSLAEFWERVGERRLASLAEEIAVVAERLHESQQPAHVAYPNLYPMF
jgi:carbamoyltransferase